MDLNQTIAAISAVLGMQFDQAAQAFKDKPNQASTQNLYEAANAWRRWKDPTLDIERHAKAMRDLGIGHWVAYLNRLE